MIRWVPILLWVSLGLIHSADASIQRFAIVVGANQGNADEVTLQYAERDARRVARILRQMGDFEADNVQLLTGVDAGSVRRAVQQSKTKIEQIGEDSALFLLFYSGHADAEALHLGGSLLPLAELERLVDRSGAGARILVVDACRSGAVTRVKGGHSGPSFAIELEDQLEARGLAVLTSSAAGEDSQESDELQASFFTHYLVSAMRGAADKNTDGLVTINEAFEYTASRTLAATASTVAGPQHPTYRMEMGGRQALVLTAPGRHRGRHGHLSFDEAGEYIIHGASAAGHDLVAEVMVSAQSRHLALPVGEYTVTRRTTYLVEQGSYTVSRGVRTRVERDQMVMIHAPALALKGGTSVGLSVFALGGVSGPVLNLGVAGRTDLGIGWDLRWASLELRVAYATSRAVTRDVSADRHELGLHVAALYPFRLGRVSLGLGVELGGLWLGQRFAGDSVTDRDGSAFVGGLVTRVDVALWRNIFLRIDGAFLTYVMESGTAAETASLDVPLSYRAGMGLGARF
jgi:hypothetical protein